MKDIPSALAELQEASKLDAKNPRVLNLRGACYVETRDFQKALKEFSTASEIAPQNSDIQFNMGEVYFVTERWRESIAALGKAKQLSKPDEEVMRDLIDFKIMLCHAGLGDAKEFKRLASVNMAKGSTSLAHYTRASMMFEAGNGNAGNAILLDSPLKAPDPVQRAIWDDTMVEFGYMEASQNLPEAEQVDAGNRGGR